MTADIRDPWCEEPGRATARDDGDAPESETPETPTRPPVTMDRSGALLALLSGMAPKTSPFARASVAYSYGVVMPHAGPIDMPDDRRDSRCEEPGRATARDDGDAPESETPETPTHPPVTMDRTGALQAHLSRIDDYRNGIVHVCGSQCRIEKIDLTSIKILIKNLKTKEPEIILVPFEKLRKIIRKVLDSFAPPGMQEGQQPNPEEEVEDSAESEPEIRRGFDAPDRSPPPHSLRGIRVALTSIRLLI